MEKEKFAVAVLKENIFQAQSRNKDLSWESIRKLSDSDETANSFAKQANEKFGIGISYKGARLKNFD